MGNQYKLDEKSSSLQPSYDDIFLYRAFTLRVQRPPLDNPIIIFDVVAPLGLHPLASLDENDARTLIGDVGDLHYDRIAILDQPYQI